MSTYLRSKILSKEYFTLEVRKNNKIFYIGTETSNINYDNLQCYEFMPISDSLISMDESIMKTLESFSEDHISSDGEILSGFLPICLLSIFEKNNQLNKKNTVQLLDDSFEIVTLGDFEAIEHDKYIVN